MPASKMIGVEAGGRGKRFGEHAARLAAAAGFAGARPGVLQGTYTYVLQTATAKSPPRIPFPRASIIRRSVPSMPGSRTNVPRRIHGRER